VSRSRPPRLRLSAQAARSRDHCLDLAAKGAGGIDADHGVFGGTLPSERSRLRGTFPEASAYRRQRQAAKRLGIHRDALRVAFAQWGLPALERRVG
jgi:hypothetical protein